MRQILARGEEIRSDVVEVVKKSEVVGVEVVTSNVVGVEVVTSNVVRVEVVESNVVGVQVVMSDVVGVEVVMSDVVGVVEDCQRRRSEKVLVVDACNQDWWH